MQYSNLKKSICFFTYPPPTLIHLPHRFTSASKPAAWKYFDCCLIHFRISVSISSSSAKHLPPSFEPFQRQTLPAVNRKHFFMNILCIGSFCPQKAKNNRTLLFGSTLLKHGSHFDYWNQPLNMRMRLWYLDYHEPGLCCYLAIHTENLLCPLQLFYFHWWPIY
jgi:hypothetical protein